MAPFEMFKGLFGNKENEDPEEIEISLDQNEISVDEDELAEYLDAPGEEISWIERLKTGLNRTRNDLFKGISGIMESGELDEETEEALEEALIKADVGVPTVMSIMEDLHERSGSGVSVRDNLKDIMKELLPQKAEPLHTDFMPITVILVVGVNGVGKTTTIAKLAYHLKQQGKKILLAAGDTFRAGAIEQLDIWAKRIGVDIVRHTLGADAAAVVYDSLKAATSRDCEVLIIDTAGRLHNKFNLMEELAKVNRIIQREIPAAPHETLLVLDATCGQNALMQARQFKESVDVTGLVITKLDGSSRGGMLLAINRELGLPIRYIGVGEKMNDLALFDPEEFTDALFS